MRDSRKVSGFRALLVLLATVIFAVAGGATVLLAQTAQPDGAQRITFEDGSAAQLCTGGELEHTHFTYAEDDRGYATPEAAADAYVQETVRLTEEFIDVQAAQGLASERTLVDLLEPSLEVTRGERTDSLMRGMVFFDNSDSAGILESRIVIHSEPTGHFVEDVYRCVDTLTKDSDAMAELLTNRGER